MKFTLTASLLLTLTLASTVRAEGGARLSSVDRDLLARLALAEARSEGSLGMAAVVRSVLNRSALVRDGLPPGTYAAKSGSIRDIVYAPGQYEPVADGSLGAARSAAELAKAQAAVDLALDTERLREGITKAASAQAAEDVLSATGFRTRTAFRDPSQGYRRRIFGNHVFNGDRFSAQRNVPAIHARVWREAKRSGAAGALSGALTAGSVRQTSTAKAGAPRPRSTAKPTAAALSARGVRRKQRRPCTPLARLVRGGERLRFGARGAPVEELQRRIGVQQTGLFGPTTQEALKGWQSENGVAPTGEVGATTLKRLQTLTEPLAAPRKSTQAAYERGRTLGPIEVVTIDGKPVAVDTARGYLRMRAAAQADGLTLRLNSGFRSHAEQQRLYRAYINGRGNLAARPGYSNHQSGRAVDINVVEDRVLRWLRAHAGRFGFKATVPSEPWHWEFSPPK